MDSPFCGRSYWNLPSRSRSRYNMPSVREIPVQYVGSDEERPSRSDSAVKIQKVLRGFLVRKSVKKIKEIRNEVEEIERRISTEGTIDLLVRDSRERLRFNEMLMGLLFRLDSVRGVDSGVRDFRKAVIKKAIALQEFLDAAFSSKNNKYDHDGENAAETVDDQNQTAEAECAVEEGEKTEELDEKEATENQNDRKGVDDYDDVNPSVSNGVPEPEPEPEERVGTSQSESQTDSSANPEEDEISSPKQENNAAEENVKQSGGEGTGDENSKNKELLEKMMADNERMMEMMEQLCERNEMQTRLLSSLSQRVEQLERAFLCERLRRKKKRQAAGAVDGGCGNSPDNKCGKKQ